MDWKQIVKLGTQVGAGFIPGAGPALTTVPLIIAAVKAAEQVFTGPGRGAEKKQYVMEFAAYMLMATEGIVGKDLLNDTAFANLVSDAIDAAVAVDNAVKHARKLREGVPVDDSTNIGADDEPRA